MKKLLQVSTTYLLMVVFLATTFLNTLTTPLAHAVDPWWDSSWTRRIKLDFGNASRAENLTNFTVLVALNSGNIDYTKTKDDGSDLRFLDADGTTVLDYEIEKWDEAGTSYVWVKVPQIDASSNTDYMYMYYNNASATAGATGTATWESNYHAVQHLAEAAAGPFQDSTTNNRDGTAVDTTTPGTLTSETAKIGNGLNFGGAADGSATEDYINEGDAPFASLPTGVAEIWFNTDLITTAETTNQYLISRVKTGSTNDGEWRLFLDTTTASGNLGKITFNIDCYNGTLSQFTINSTTTIIPGTWYHVAAAWSEGVAGAMKLYINGVQEAASGSTLGCGMESTAVSTTVAKNNAASSGTTGYFDGKLDEFRMSNTLRSGPWISASYASQNNTLLTYNTAETYSTGSLSSTNVQPASLFTDATGNVTVSFTTTNTLPANGKVVVTFPTSLGSGFTFNSGGSTAASSLSGLDGSLSVSVASNIITLTRTGGTDSTAGAKSFVLSNIQNPNTAGSTGVYGIKTTYSNNVLIDEDASVSADTITAPPTAPGTPLTLTAAPYDTKVYLSWLIPTGTVTDYIIEYKLSSEPTTWTTFSDGTSTNLYALVTGLTNGLAYDFRVTTSNSGSLSSATTPVSTTPAYRMTFLSPTPSANSFINTTSINPKADVNDSVNASYTTFRLETSLGALVTEFTSPTRYGDYSLASSSLQQVRAKTNLALSSTDLSGHVYVPTTDTFFTVHNSQNAIKEITREGFTVRDLTCASCGDIEDITLVSSDPDGSGGYNHTLMISTEDFNTTNLRIFRVVIPSSGTPTLNSNTYFETDLTSGSNDGLEGIAYNSNTNTYFVSIEGQATGSTRPRVYEVTLATAPNASNVEICSNLNFRDYLTQESNAQYGVTTLADISGLDFVPSLNRLYVISHQADKVIEVDVSNRSNCSVLNEIAIGMRNDRAGNHLDEMPEGVAWDNTGDYLYLSSESDYWSIWRTTNYDVRSTFSGLAEGSYVLKAYYTDSYASRSTATVTSNPSGTTATVTYGGSGYGDVPLVTVTNAGTCTTRPTATATISGGLVTGVSLSGAVGCTVAPTLTIAPPSFATARSNNTGTTATVVTGGYGYTSAPTVIVSGGFCTTLPTATATVSGGAVTGVTLSGASGCITPPTLTIAGPITVVANAANRAFTIDTTAPRVNNISSDHADGTFTTGEVIDIDVTFSEAVTSTGNVTVTLETGTTDRTCTFTVTSSTTGTCNYTVQAGDVTSDLTVNSISGTIADAAGNAMVNFTPVTNLGANKAIVISSADTTNPLISTLSPADNATSVSPAANLVLTFDEAVAVGSGNITIKKTSDDSTVEAIAVGSGLVTGGGTTTITVNPTANLLDSTGYYVLVDATAFDDLAGNSYAGIASTTAWNFTTGDTVNPAISTLSPADNATSVSPAANLVLTFDEAVAVGSGNITIKKTSDDSTVEAIAVGSGLVTGGGTTTITVNPTANLLDSTGYYVLVDATAFDDLAGNSYAGIASTTAWNFTTGDTTAPNTTVLTSPSLNANADTGIFTFSSDEGASTFECRIDSGSYSSCTSPFVTSTLTAGLHTFYVRATDSSSNTDATPASYAWTIDLTNPTISTLSPADNATNISPTDNLVLTFDAAVVVGTGNITLKKTSDDSTIQTFDVSDTLSGLVLGTGTTTITVNPTSALADSTGYYVLVDATAFDDLAGNSYAGIASTTAWNFTTGVAGSGSPAAGGGGGVPSGGTTGGTTSGTTTSVPPTNTTPTTPTTTIPTNTPTPPTTGIVQTLTGKKFVFSSEEPKIAEKLGLTPEVYQNTCATNAGKPYYRKCILGTSLNTTDLFRENVVCEGFIVKRDTVDEYRYGDVGPRKEVVGIAVKMRRNQGEPVSFVTPDAYKKIYTDIGKGEASWIQPVVETALKYDIISSARTSFEGDRPITRSEAYAVITKAICIAPEKKGTEGWQESIYRLAFEYGLTTRTWSNFEPNTPILRQELFVLASKAADLAERTGGCNPKPEMCFVKG